MLTYEKIETWIKELTNDELTMNQIEKVEFGFGRGIKTMVKVTSYAQTRDGKKFFGGDDSNNAAKEVRWYPLKTETEFLNNWAAAHKVNLTDVIHITVDYETCREARNNFACMKILAYAKNGKGQRFFDEKYRKEAAKVTSLKPLQYLP